MNILINLLLFWNISQQALPGRYTHQSESKKSSNLLNVIYAFSARGTLCKLLQNFKYVNIKIILNNPLSLEYKDNLVREKSENQFILSNIMLQKFPLIE